MENKKFLVDEANRCLLCKNPRCTANCPINTPIPEIISLYKEGKVKEAGEILFNNNPLSVVCSLVCPHEDQCKGNCVRGIKGEPISFHDIEDEISKKYIEETHFENVEKDKDRIAIIGGGPAGITIAFILARKGYDITIFDAHGQIGGVLRYGIPEYRLPKKLIYTIEERLVELGVKIRPNTLIGPVITLDRLFEDGYKAAFIGTGVWNPKTLDIKGETLGNVHYAIDYLKSPEFYRLGDNVAIIGAGNVAMDAARSAKRYGAKNVTILYRKGFEEMPATKQEIREAKEDGIKFELLRAPIEIKENGIKLAVTENVTDSEGRVKTKIIEGKEEFFDCDSVIIAVSQNPRANIVSNTTELNTNKWGLLITDDKGNTTKKGTFASGDVVTGAKTVVEAVVQAKIVAETIEEYCKNN
ncbi:NAD(P)-dependent oxidoreductase [Clostridium sp. BL-8]|uniref:NAD(P)-dependent oxidoreductase n=1 Tax=Clostridium sp. BL-8 TaxID=349938 RepID=UPI00098CD58F|nr:NAD(P)-dependent oxidoreductase [Clostridium sp. BL-8]OOM78487.1 glutamate synthase [NADPH] small chain [Clostridium sp. BL-8]